MAEALMVFVLVVAVAFPTIAARSQHSLLFVPGLTRQVLLLSPPLLILVSIRHDSCHSPLGWIIVTR
jgi:hypothetical protein